MKKIILLLMFLFLIDLVLAESNLSKAEFLTIYNSFTGKQDYVRGYNWSRYNVTFGCLNLNGNKICSWDVINLSSSYDDTLIRQSIIDNITSYNVSIKIYIGEREVLVRNSILTNITDANNSMKLYVDVIDSLIRSSILSNISSANNSINIYINVQDLAIRNSIIENKTASETLLIGHINNNITAVLTNGTLQHNNGTLQNTLIAGANITIIGTTVSVTTGLYMNLKNTFDTIYQSIGSYITNLFLDTNYYNKTQVNTYIANNKTASETLVKGYIDTNISVINGQVLNISNIGSHNITLNNGKLAVNISMPVNTFNSTLDMQRAINGSGYYNIDAQKCYNTYGLSGENITSGTVADVRIASTIARDSEIINNCSIANSCGLIVYGSNTTNWDKDTSDDATTAMVNGNYTVLNNRDNAINTSANIQSFITAVFLKTLGFNTTTELTAYYNTLYALTSGLFTNANFTERYYAQTDRYTDANISGTESAFNNWDKLSSDDFSNTNFTTNYGTIGAYKLANLTSDLANNPVNTTKDFNINLKFNVSASTGVVSMSNNLSGIDCIIFKNGGAICSS